MNVHNERMMAWIKFPKIPNFKEFFRRQEECHESIQREIDKIKTTINGDDTWMKKKPDADNAHEEK